MKYMIKYFMKYQKKVDEVGLNEVLYFFLKLKSKVIISIPLLLHYITFCNTL
ncbi:hypothetical protein [Carp edema virus]|nr:hypothetical protein [Carp edema virus]